MSFTKEQKEALLKAFDDGLQSSSKSNDSEINQLATELNCTVKRIKNFIGNERRKRKGNSINKPPQKIRCPNGYNIFTREFRQSEDAKQLTLEQQNAKVGSLWREMTDDDKRLYYTLSKAIETSLDGSLLGTSSAATWKEAKRVMDNMQISSNWAQKFDIHCCFMVAHGGNHYVGGTEYGRQFLENNLHLPVLFLSDVQNRKAKSSQQSACSIHELRKRLHDQLNDKYTLTTGDPTGKISYASNMASQIIGWPQSVPFCHPNNLSERDLKKLSAAMENIKFHTGVLVQTQSTCTAAVLNDHTYCYSSSSSGNSSSNNNSKLPSSSGTVVSTSLQQIQDVSSLHLVPENAEVTLLKGSNHVGHGIVVEGTVLHGIDLPSGYIKVIIKEVTEDVPPPIAGKFTGNSVEVGEIHGWPMKELIVK